MIFSCKIFEKKKTYVPCILGSNLGYNKFFLSFFVLAIKLYTLSRIQHFLLWIKCDFIYMKKNIDIYYYDIIVVKMMLNK